MSGNNIIIPTIRLHHLDHLRTPQYTPQESHHNTATRTMPTKRSIAAEAEAEASDTENKRRRRSEEEEPDDDESSGEEQERVAHRVAGNINTPGKPAEAGIIKRVYVQDFMCHRKLTVDLCQNVNFIHGANGSGEYSDIRNPNAL
eukprot:scaffold190887_cov50-Attheya_sp.AAC.1